MITRDFLMRQIHQMTQALAQVLFKKQVADHDAVQELLEMTLEQVTGFSLAQIRRLSQDELLGLCAADGIVHGDKALALADLLIEAAAMQERRDQNEAAYASRERALWLYEAAMQAGGTLPLDIHERLAGLRAQLAA